MNADVKVPRLFTTKELSEATGIPRWRLFELISRGEGPPSMRIGKTFRFPEDAVVEWIRQESRKSQS